jgi:hypothetical protein
MRNYRQSATGDMSLQQGCKSVVVNAAPIAQSGILNYCVPLNLLPYKKDQITTWHNPKGTIMEYRPVIKGGQQCAWIGHLAKNGQLWDDEDDCEMLNNMEGKASMGTSLFLIVVVRV